MTRNVENISGCLHQPANAPFTPSLEFLLLLLGFDLYIARRPARFVYPFVEAVLPTLLFSRAGPSPIETSKVSNLVE